MPKRRNKSRSKFRSWLRKGWVQDSWLPLLLLLALLVAVWLVSKK
ncbi:hypothetical protein [Hymenobacter nivis]|nr:hypothetical protein [Hymenobacter nivis]